MTGTVAIPADMQEALGTVERIGGRELVAKIGAMFEKSARERLARLPGLIAAWDRHQVSRVAHAMKGSAAQVGASHLRDLAAALEKDAASLEEPALAERVAAIAAECEDVFARLARYAASLEGAA